MATDNTFVLLQAPDGEIIIRSNSDTIGKNRCMKLCMNGCKPVGTVTTSLSLAALRAGVARKEQNKLDEYVSLFRQIDELACKWADI